MAFYIFNVPVGSLNQSSGKYVKFGKMNKQDDGTVTFSYPDDAVLSVQPDGDWQARPAGTNGPYEKATVNGNTVNYVPNDSEEPYVYMMFESKAV